MTVTDAAGRLVPWITRWSGQLDGVAREIRPSVNFETGQIRVRYPDNGPEFRDGLGILWQRELLNRAGEPQFAQVSTFRQRAAMQKTLCQVCGTRITARPILWLLPAVSLRHSDDGRALTMSAPTCEACIPVAIDACPFLGKPETPKVLAKVLAYEPWGVYGNRAVFDKLQGIRIERPASMSHVALVASKQAGAVIAQQQIVTLTKFTMEDYA